jgi:lipopolysaccharide biosynthesis glycosyltransferase
MRYCVLVATDERFARPAAIALRSIERQSPGTMMVVADIGLTSDTRTLISRAASNVSFSEVTPAMLSPFEASPYQPAIFARILLDQLVGADVERVLYLDADTFARRPIDELLHVELADCIVGAVPMWGAAVGGNPPSVGIDEQRTGRYAESVPAGLGIPPAVLLFNSGVMVVDRRRWREAQVAERVAELAKDIHLADQALLNFVLWDRWMPLDLIWNGKDGQAAIAHFAGDRKPWDGDYYANELNLEYRVVAQELGIEIPEPFGLRGRVLIHRLASRWVPPALR